MTILLYSTFLIIALLLLFNNLLPTASTQYSWFFKLAIAALTALAYIFLMPQILQPVISEGVRITLCHLAPEINPVSGQFLIDNTRLILLAFFTTIILFKSLQIPAWSTAEKSQISTDAIIKHHINIILGLFICGICLIICDNLVHLLFSQILLSGVIIYRQIIVESHSPDSSHASDYFWAILADILLILAILLIYQNLKTFSISGIAEAWNRNPSFIPSQTVAGIFILTAFILKLALIPYRHSHLRYPESPPAIILKDNTIEIALILFISFYKFKILLCDTCLFITVILGFGIAIITALISIVVDNPDKILKYLLSAQIGLFLILVGNGLHISGLLFLIAFGFANLLLVYWSGVPIHSEKTAIKKHFAFTSTSNWIALFAATAICGFPLTAGFLSRSALLTSYFNQIQTTPAAWIYIVLIFIIFALISFSVFRYLFLSTDESLSSQTTGKPHNPGTKPIIVFLILLNLSIIYTLPKFNPLLNVGWIWQLIAAADISRTVSILNIYIILTIITLPTLIGFFLALLTYYFEIIEISTIQKIFNPVKRVVQSFDSMNIRLVRFIDTSPARLAGISEYINNNITKQLNHRISQTTNYGIKFYDWISRIFKWQSKTRLSDLKLLTSIQESLFKRENLMPLIIIVIIIIAVVISII